MTNITFKIINHGSFEYESSVKLREEILRKPLGLIFSPEELLAEKNHIQVVGFQGDEVISTAVLVPEGQSYKMQRVVVKQSLQDAGIGSQMMEFCESYSRGKGAHSIYCHARDAAVHFYLKNHYITEGDYFDEDNISHLKMRKVL